MRHPPTIPRCDGRWRWRWTARPLSTSSPRGRATSAGPCSHRRKGCGACRRQCSRVCPAMIPMCKKNRAEARAIVEKFGYRADKRLEVKVSERNIAIFRDPAVILIDQLKEVYIDGELDPIETANWFPKIYRKDYTIGLNLTGVGA